VYCDMGTVSTSVFRPRRLVFHSRWEWSRSRLTIVSDSCWEFRKIFAEYVIVEREKDTKRRKDEIPTGTSLGVST